MPTNVLKELEARRAVMDGIDLVADSAKVTLGASGANAILEEELPPYHRITNDGVSVARSIQATDPYINVGVNLMKEIATKADKESGDGTTTTMVLAQAILHEGMSTTEIAPMELKRQLDECLPVIMKSLDAQKKDITVDEVGKVALISSEDEEMADLLQKAYQAIGPTGVIELENSHLPETFFDIIDGVRLRGAGSMGAYSNTETGRAVYNNPSILITKQRIATADELFPICKALAEQGKNELVIYCDEIDMSVASRLAYTHMNGGFKTLLIKSPNLWKSWLYEDFALLTGARIIDPAEGKTFKNVTMSDLGTCDKLITTKDETRLLGTLDISGHIADLKEAGKTDDQQLVRAAWLETKVAILKVGANSESELSYKRLKAIDAINACKLALEEGVIPGGGSALVQASLKLPDTVGGHILQAALLMPARQIADNAGREDIVIGADYYNGFGLNAKTGAFVDMWEADIIDPVKVTKNAVRTAISVAGSVLTTKVLVIRTKDTTHEAFQ